MHSKGLLILIAFLYVMHAYAQETTNADFTRDTTRINMLIQKSKGLFNVDPEGAINLANEAKVLSAKVAYPKGEALALKNIGLAYYFQGKYVETLNYWKQSLSVYEAIKDEDGIANLLNNLGAIYFNQGDNVKALEYYLKSLKIAEHSGNKEKIMMTLNNIGNIYSLKETTFDKALYYYQKALPICVQLGNANSLGSLYVNIGKLYAKKGALEKALEFYANSLNAYGKSEGSSDVYNEIGELRLKQGKYDLALKSHSQALAVAQKFNVTFNIVQAYRGLGNANVKLGDYNAALDYFSKAEASAVEIKANSILVDLYKEIANAYSMLGNYGKAFAYQSKYSDVKDTIYNEETGKKIGLLQMDFDLQKKQGEVDLLTKDKQLQEVELKRQTFAKNAFMGGLILIFIIAFIIYRNYKAKVRINKILDHQKMQIEQLLLNILPQEVAKELQESGHATPRDYEKVSVLFTDFKNFTTIADKMSPGELVDELNHCFMAFDDIIEKHRLEKIKTIGDSYMCAGGIPTPDEEHPYNIVKAGLEIQQYVIQNNLRRFEKGLPPWDIRVGIHVGPLVAGVVGKKKYAYDIWGSTVNIASRMESNGEPGLVNISSATYELVKNRFRCKYRGKIYAKNVGEVDMYFIDGLVESSTEMISAAPSKEMNVTIPDKEPEKFDLDTLYG
jgi:class 3 adenylate cyclase/Tfp pilus assembly protein PilF